MKKEKLMSILYFAGSVCFFIAAGIEYMTDNSMAPAWLCLGAAMLCLGSAKLNKKKDKRSNDENDTDKNDNF